MKKNKNNFIKSNLQKGCVIYSPKGDYSFLEPLPEGYKRVGMVPHYHREAYTPRVSEVYFGNGFNRCGFIILYEINGLAVTSKPNKYQQRLIRKYLPLLYKAWEEQEKELERKKAEPAPKKPVITDNGYDWYNDPEIWVNP